LYAIALRCGYGHKGVVDYLLAHGAKPNAETTSGVTPLDLALYKGYEAVAKALLAAGASVKTKVKSDTSRSGYATFSFNAGQTPLHITAQSGFSGLIPELLKQGLDLNAQDAGGRTALSYAVEKNNEPVVRALLAAGADVNLGSSPPLHLACLHDFKSLAELLLAKGADPNLEAPFEQNRIYSPMEIAVTHKHPEILRLLLRNKGNPNQTIKGVPLVFNTVAEPPLLKLLLEAGAKADVHYGGISSLEAAVRQHNILAAELLIAHGSSPTPAALFSAIHESTTNMVELLIKHHADVNARDSYEQTPLHLAVRTSKIAIAKLLLEHRADPNLRDADGATPLDLAKAMLPNGSQTGGPTPITTPKNPQDVRLAAAKLINLLREHGARDDLPRLDRIEVTRPSSGYSRIVITKGTNDWNQFTLLELIAAHYQLISTQPSGSWRSRNGTASTIWPNDLVYPDLSNLIIHRPSTEGKDWQTIQVNVSEILSADDCSRDVWLQWGDVVEVPETDHPIAERWQGIPDATVSNLLKCVSRQITVKLKGTQNLATLASEYGHNIDSFDPNGKRIPSYKTLSASFMLRSVLDQMKLIRFSSDLTRVKITRHDAKTGKSPEWVLDCSNSEHTPSFWLRDGDVVEIPDK
jgi:ankyrin repeat protein